MSSEFNPERKNPAFLAQLFNETLYHISEDRKETEQYYEEAEISAEENTEQSFFVAEERDAGNDYSEAYKTESEDELKDNLKNGHSGNDKSEKDLNQESQSLQTANHNQTGKSASDENAETEISKELDISSSATPEINSIDFFGQYRQKILILVTYPNQKNLIPKDQMVLERILAALGISFDDVAIVNVEKAQLTFNEIQEQMGWHKLIAFGVKHDFIPFEVPENELTSLENGEKIFLAPNIAEIAASKNLKRMLWQNLKTLFNQ